MKGFKFMFAAALLAATTSASAQFEDTTEPTENAPKAPTYSLMAKRPIHEISLYMQDGWGLGYQLRKDINRYIAWNIIGASYMVAPIKKDPSDGSQINLKLFGVRLNSPSFDKKFRFYTELNLGYSFNCIGPKTINHGEQLVYDKEGKPRHNEDGTPIMEEVKLDAPLYISRSYFGLDFGVGMQIGKHFTIGYNLNFVKGSKYSYIPEYDSKKGEYVHNRMKNSDNDKDISHWVKISCLF